METKKIVKTITCGKKFKTCIIKKKNANHNTTGRERQNINVEDASGFAQIPSCSHGPCLLFSNREGLRWFACAVFRQSKECKFKVGVDRSGKLWYQNTKTPRIYTRSLSDYGLARKSFEQLIAKGVQPYWCAVCADFVSAEHDEHLANVRGPFATFPAPTRLLNALQNDKGEAQYWFSWDTLSVLDAALTAGDFDAVLCVGAPSLFEFLSASPTSASRRQFLLDVDDRLSAFYDSSEFARYSMLVDYFFNGTKAREKLREFCADVRRLAVVCDPPFGVHVGALMRSLDALGRTSLAAESSCNKSDFTSKFIVFLPLFVGKYLLRERVDFSMVDFKVTYMNHKDFVKADRSIVRIFTDMPNRNFVLPTRLGYRFCAPCERYVANGNAHCKKCKRCTSMDGSTYVHCDACGKCVKSTYAHCTTCKACHLRDRCLLKAKVQEKKFTNS